MNLDYILQAHGLLGGGVKEDEFKGPYQNLSRLAIATATSRLSTAYIPSKAIDGNKTDNASRWIGGGAPDYSPILTISLAQLSLIDKITLYSGNNYPSTTHIIEKYDIWYMDKNDSWVKLLIVTNNNNWEKTHIFEPIQAKKIEFRFPFSSDYYRVYEIEIHGRGRE